MGQQRGQLACAQRKQWVGIHADKSANRFQALELTSEGVGSWNASSGSGSALLPSAGTSFPFCPKSTGPSGPSSH